jgi:signal transduction histidine kinase
MENLIQDLLDYSQIKAGKFRKNLKYFDIRDTVRETFGILKTKAEAKNITLEHQFDNLTDE